MYAFVEEQRGSGCYLGLAAIKSRSNSNVAERRRRVFRFKNHHEPPNSLIVILFLNVFDERCIRLVVVLCQRGNQQARRSRLIVATCLALWVRHTPVQQRWPPEVLARLQNALCDEVNFKKDTNNAACRILNTKRLVHL